MRKRTQAREIALKALYQHDLRKKADREAIATVDDFEPFIAEESARWGDVAQRAGIRPA